MTIKKKAEGQKITGNKLKMVPTTNKSMKVWQSRDFHRRRFYRSLHDSVVNFLASVFWLRFV